MTRVAHVITGLGSGGAEGFLARIVPELSGRGWDSTVISLTGVGVHGDDLSSRGSDVHALGLQSTRPSPATLWRLRSILCETRPSVVMTWLYHADLIGGLVARSLGIPVVWNVRQSDMGPEAPRIHHVLLRLNRRLARRIPQRVVYVSQAARSVHESAGYPADLGVVIHNGFDTNEFSPDQDARLAVRAELGIPPEAPVVGLVARFDPQKDHRTALEAFAQVTAQLPAAHLILCGEGMTASNPAVLRLIEDTGLSAQIRLLGRRSDIYRIDAAMDVAISSSAYGEGLTNALGEAMACGVPCVATDSGDARELLGSTGTVVPSRTPAALAAAVVAQINLNSRPSEESRSRIVEGFSITKSASAYADLLRSVTNGG